MSVYLAAIGISFIAIYILNIIYFLLSFIIPKDSWLEAWLYCFFKIPLFMTPLFIISYIFVIYVFTYLHIHLGFIAFWIFLFIIFSPLLTFMWS